jgi:ABC-2 type transport system ATP-binding protein
MTILLTTQYLEEADELAHRVGIIDGGRLVAEGTPTELKRQVGDDLIIARVEGDVAAAAVAVRGVDGVEVVDASGHELVVACPDGARAIGPVAVAIAAASIELRDLTLRTPTLDDVFLEMTGNRLRNELGDRSDASEPEPGERHVGAEREEVAR